MRAGLREFNSEILGPPAGGDRLATADRWTQRFRARAAIEVAALTRQRSASKPVQVAKRVQDSRGG